jgi:4-hydroxy-tetrahydrodipicolinate synthase
MTDTTDTPGLRGIVGALLTPFDEDGAVDRPALEREVDLLAGHCDAVSVAGAEVSEYRVLSPAARRELIRDAIGLVDGRLPVLAGVSAPSLAEIAELAALAADAGATYAQVLLPHRTWGGEPQTREVVAFTESVVAASALPVVLYHNPGQGADPSFDAIVAACAVDGVVAIKDSSRNVSRTLRAVEEIDRAGHARYLATIQPLLTVLLAGGSGAMAPPPSTLVGAAIRDAVTAGDVARAVELQRLVSVFPARWTASHGLAPTAKAAMTALGMPLGDPGHPHLPVPEDDARAIAALVGGWPSLAGVPTLS